MRPSRSMLLALCQILLCLSLASAQSAADVERELSALEAILPESAEGFSKWDTSPVDHAAKQIERGCALVSESAISPGQSPLPPCQTLLNAKVRIDACLEQLFALRGGFAAQPDTPERTEAARAYLRTVSRLIDLSGRLRYLQFDAFDYAAAVAVENPKWRKALPDAAIKARSIAAGNAWSVALFADDSAATLPVNGVLELFRVAPDPSHVGALVEYLNDPRRTSSEVLRAVDVLRVNGIPQDPPPGEKEKPLTTAALLAERLSKIDAKQLSKDERQLRDELNSYLTNRAQHGVTEEEYSSGGVTVRPGDWILMRNPSPYNHFSSLSPGLFTHVGVVTDVTGKDGKRRFMVVDLPERGSSMPATNFDMFVLQTLHYVVMRHPDPAVAARMAEVARTLIDAPTEFDLNFDTSTAVALKGKIAPGVKVKTYCAGLLLVCAQETSVEREAFFPFSETVAGGNTAENLATLGLAIHDDFISPTGPLFSPTMQLVGRREALYEPGREIREAVYDYFAEGLAKKALVSTPNAQQALRIRLAEMARENPLLADALASANGVSADLDLVSAAKAAAVVETLDVVADAAAREYVEARDALRAGNARELRAQRLAPQVRRAIDEYRQRHQRLYQQWERGEATPRQLRETLVAYYIARGRQQIDQRFFAETQD